MERAKQQMLIIGMTTFLLLQCSVDSHNIPWTNNKYVKAAYWPSYRASYMPPSSIRASLYTHIFYAFADINNQTFEVNVSSNYQKTIAEFTPTVLKINPSLKTLISIGGGGGAGGANGSDFARMAKNAFTRKIFIKSSISLARLHGFHGLDLDWEFPQNTSEMENMGKLFSEWRHNIQIEARSSGRTPLLLTAAVYFAQHFFVWGEKRAYPTTSMAQNLDWANVMCYDYHGSWDTSSTGAHAALYDPFSNISTSYGIGSWMGSGLPSHKVVMGMPLYGRSWILKSAHKTGIGAPAVAAGPKLKLSDETGVMFYEEIRDFIKEKNATEVFDKETVSAYSYAGDLWVGYDNQESVAGKIDFAKQKALLGYFFWAISQDSNWTLSITASKSWNKRF